MARNTEPDRATPHEAIVAANVRRFREAAGWSQAEVSKRAAAAGYDLGEMPVWGLENGRRRMKVEDLFTLAEVFGTTPQYLLTPDADPAGAMAHEIRFEGDVAEHVVADHIEWSDGWAWFYAGSELVYSASAARVLGIRTTRES
ncbi:helix-turn-helix domain-containing protein [Streptomyces spinosirectus]